MRQHPLYSDIKRKNYDDFQSCSQNPIIPQYIIYLKNHRHEKELTTCQFIFI